MHHPGSSASSASSVPLSDDFLQDNTPKPESDLGKRFGTGDSAGGAGVGGIGGVGGGLSVPPGASMGGDNNASSTGSGSSAQKIDLSE